VIPLRHVQMQLRGTWPAAPRAMFPVVGLFVLTVGFEPTLAAV